MEQIPPPVLTAFDRERSLGKKIYGNSELTWPTFKDIMSKAIETMHASSDPANDGGKPRVFQHPMGDGKGMCAKCNKADHKTFECPLLVPCPLCGDKMCARGAFADAECQVHGNPAQKRIDKWPDSVLKVINASRAKAGKKALTKSSPSVNAHGNGAECAECDDDAEPEPTAEGTAKEHEKAMAALEAFMMEHEVAIPKTSA